MENVIKSMSFRINTSKTEDASKLTIQIVKVVNRLFNRVDETNIKITLSQNGDDFKNNITRLHIKQYIKQ